MKKSQNIYKLRCENIEDGQFEMLIEDDLNDIEDFLNSYTVNKVEEEKIDSTIDILKAYMPKVEVEEIQIKNEITFVEIIKNNLELVKFQFGLMNKMYFIVSLLLVLVGTISTIKLNLSIYFSASIIAPIPILLGIFEIIKGRDENVWELELSYKNSLREIVLSRLIIINAMSILISIFISIILNNSYSEINLIKMISIWLVPIFTMVSMSLIITSIYRNINSIGLCIAVWILGIMCISLYERIGDITNINIFAVLVLSVVGATIAIKVFYKKSINSMDYVGHDF